MNMQCFTYPVTILETYLDMLGHMNNAVYLTLFEEARWDLVTQQGFGLKKIMETGLAPTILEVKMQYLKEIRLREEIIIETQLLSCHNKIGKIRQRMRRQEEICCTAEFTFGILDLKKRTLVLPPPEWLAVMGGKSE
jgi:thioesterase-3